VKKVERPVLSWQPSMGMSVLLFTASAFLLLTGCESISDRQQRLRESSLAANTCVVHGVALKTIRLYVQTEKGDLFFDPEVHQAYSRFPNAVPLSHVRASSSMFARAEIVPYCPLCEAAVASRLSQNAR
jgi:hypothetical protein